MKNPAPTTPPPPPPPPPANPKWHSFANHVLGGKSLVDAYLAAGFQSTRAAAYVNASKLRRKPAVATYIGYWMRKDSRSRSQPPACED